QAWPDPRVHAQVPRHSAGLFRTVRGGSCRYCPREGDQGLGPGVAASRMSSILFFFQGARRRVILSERAERARAKDLLEDAWRMRAKGASSRPREVAAGDGGDRLGE